MVTMTEQELDTLTSMSDEDLEQFYDKKLRKLKKEKNTESSNEEDGKTILFRIGDELVELEGLSDEEMTRLMATSDTLITKEELNNLKQFVSGVSEEDMDLISNMTDEELERFYDDNVDSGNQRSKRETDEDDITSKSYTEDFQEDSLRISQSKVKREANPDPEPEAEPLGLPQDRHFDFIKAETKDAEQRFLEDYVRRFR